MLESSDRSIVPRRGRLFGAGEGASRRAADEPRAFRETIRQTPFECVAYSSNTDTCDTVIHHRVENDVIRSSAYFPVQRLPAWGFEIEMTLKETAAGFCFDPMDAEIRPSRSYPGPWGELGVTMARQKAARMSRACGVYLRDASGKVYTQEVRPGGGRVGPLERSPLFATRKRTRGGF